MIQLELIGCTGAGKTTLAAGIADAARAEGIDLMLGDDVVTGRLGPRNASSATWRTTVIHFATLLECLKHREQHREFLSIARRSLHAAEVPRRVRWNQIRKVLKQLGRYEVIRRTAGEVPLVLVDEGTVQSAHNLFVHVGHTADETLLRYFAECVPLPEVVIYLEVSEDELIDRTLRRGHQRIACPTRATVGRFVRGALRAFDRITRCPRIAERTIVIRDGIVAREAREREAADMKTTIDVINRALQKQSSASGVRQSWLCENRSPATT